MRLAKYYWKIQCLFNTSPCPVQQKNQLVQKHNNIKERIILFPPNTQTQHRITLNTEAVFACFFPNFIVNSIQLRWFGASWSIVSLTKLIFMHWLTILIGYCNFSDDTFTTAKWLIPECLDICDTLTICKFFHKSWHHMDSYWLVSF